MTATNRADIPVLTDDPVRNHPTRGEQLDILSTLAASCTKDGDAVLDLGVGVGYVARMLLEKRPGVRLVGVDLKPESLAQARAALGTQPVLLQGDLGKADTLDVPAGPYACAFSVLTFHDLTDAAKRSLIHWTAARLAPGGVFLLMDRLRLDQPALFPLQVALWDRMNRVYGGSMRRADTYDAYVADLDKTNTPGRLADYMAWFAEAGLSADTVHRHGNIAILAAAKPAR
jgi:tRNA (cmo5U34)-methyltransferase